MDLAYAGKLDLDADAPDLSGGEATPSNAGEGQNPDENKPADQGTGATPPGKDDEPEGGAPILSKSGAYTIPFEKLDTARKKLAATQAEKEALSQENEALKAQLASLSSTQQQNLAAAQAEAAARSESGAAATQADKNLAVAQAAAGQGVDLAIFGDFSEEGIARGVAALVAQAEERANARVDEKVAAALKPLKDKEAKSEAESHYGAIYAKHADADEIAESTEFKDWVAKQPTFVRAGITEALGKGTAQDVIEVFDKFKEAAGKAPAAGGNKAADAVAKAMAEASTAPPASLSDLPGASGLSDAEQVMALSNDPAKLMDFMASLPQEKRERLMNRVA